MDDDDLFLFPEEKTYDNSLCKFSPALKTTDFHDSLYKQLCLQGEEELINCPCLHIDELSDDLKGKTGVYVLFYFAENRSTVYIGQSARCLKERILVHKNKLVKAKKIDMTKVFFKAIVCSDSAALLIEGRLLDHYTPPWNGAESGFGRNPSTDRREKTFIPEWYKKYDCAYNGQESNA